MYWLNAFHSSSFEAGKIIPKSNNLETLRVLNDDNYLLVIPERIHTKI
jgi:hypothetical protein